MKLEWTRQADGSYESVAGRIFRHPGEQWKDCVTTGSDPIRHVHGRFGGLRESQATLENAWSFHIRRTGPLPGVPVMLAAFKEKLKVRTEADAVFVALVDVALALPVTLTSPILQEALGKWWRSNA